MEKQKDYRIYIPNFGYRYVFSDHEQIVFIWKQFSKNYNRKSDVTRYWLSLFENYESALLKVEAFELLKFLKTQLTMEQIENRAKRRVHAQAIAQVEMQKWISLSKDYEHKKNLRNYFNPN